MPIFCWVFQTEGAKMKTFSRLLPAKPFRMGSNTQWNHTLVLFFEISNICCSILPELSRIPNLELFRYLFYSQTILYFYIKIFP